MADLKISEMSPGSALSGTELFESTQSGNTVSLLASQVKTYVDTESYSYQVPTVGFSITIGANIQDLLLKPAGNLANGTVTMPAAPTDGYMVRISCTHNVSTLTLNANAGQTMLNNATSLSAGIAIAFIYVASITSWFRLH